jgi:GH25 family lysozyme M1 (1,4-beta-N-acetylmuramidase)
MTSLDHRAWEITRAHPDALLGVDVSLWQPDLDARAIVTDGVKFAILKGTEARSTDPRFLSHAKALAGHVRLGAYHLPRLCDGEWGRIVPRDPVAQAEYAGGIAKAHNHFACGHWLDLEPDDTDDKRKPPRHFEALVVALGQAGAAAWLRRWLDVFEGLLGQPAGVYLSPRLAKSGGAPLREVIGARRTWWALYQQPAAWPRTASPGARHGYSTWDMWQFRADTFAKVPGGRCRGVMGGKKDCDLNLINPASSLAQDTIWG